MEFWISSDKPIPQRKRKQVVSALEQHEEYLKMRNAILSGRMRPMQSAIITLGPDDQKKLGYLFPQRTAVDSLRRLVKSMHMESDWEIRKWETDTKGVWAVVATYTPPITKQQPHAETPAQLQEKRRPGRPRKLA